MAASVAALSPDSGIYLPVSTTAAARPSQPGMLLGQPAWHGLWECQGERVRPDPVEKLPRRSPASHPPAPCVQGRCCQQPGSPLAR